MAEDHNVSTGGYEDQLFLDLPPESPHCPVCLLVVREPHVLVCCGTPICQVCIEHTRANKRSCPSCNTKEYANIFNRKQHGELLKLRLRCTNNEKGCEWVGELGDQERHLTNECLYVEETTSETNTIQEEIEMLQEKVEASKKEIVLTVPDDLMMLLENVTEEECAEILEEAYEKYEANGREMVNEFKEGKKEMMKELKMLRERADRLHQLMEEEIRELRKLDEKITRDHEEILAQLQANDLHNSHLILELKQQLSQMKGPTVPMWYSALIRKSSPSIPPFIVNVANFTDYKKLNADYYSAPFYSSSNGYKMQLCVVANGEGECKGTHVSVFVYLMKGTNDSKLKWPFTGDISIHLLNWREDKGHVKDIITLNDNAALQNRSKVIKGERAPGGFGRLDFIPHSELDYNHENNTEYVSSDTLCFLIGNVFIPTGTDIPDWYISPETRSPHLLPPCTATMFNYNEHKRVNDEWYSVPFYTATNGYKLRLEVHANGDGPGKDTHVSIGVRLMKGENDKSLKWPLNSDISIQLLNWREDKGHVETVINHYNTSIANRTRVVDGETAPDSRIIGKFIAHSSLPYNANNNTEYLHNDTLCFRVSKVMIHTGPVIPSWYITPGTESFYLLPPSTLSMHNFSEHKRVSDHWWSKPFYTGLDGYKLQIRVDANGDGSGEDTHVSVYVYLMKSENDDVLTWPLKCDITIRLLNWREDKRHVEKSVKHYKAPIELRTRVTQGEEAPDGWGYHRFISHSDLYYNITNNTEYINNDILCFVVSKVIVYS